MVFEWNVGEKQEAEDGREVVVEFGTSEAPEGPAKPDEFARFEDLTRKLVESPKPERD